MTNQVDQSVSTVQPKNLTPFPSTSSPSEVESDPVTAIEFDNVVGMKLSDAIRAGAPMAGDQERGWGDGVHSSCALMAAAVWMRKHGYK